jgi:two-component system nitrate/nitrite response regulator NarL
MNMPSTVSVLIIDDHPLFRKGAIDLIAMEPTLSLAGEAADGEQGLLLVEQRRPNLVLLDLNMKGMDGLATLRAIKAAATDTRVVILTVSDSEDDVVAALRAGADGYLLKDAEPEDILVSLRKAAAGRMVLDEKVMECVALALRYEAQPCSADEAGLTKREREILRLIAEGLSNKRITRELDIMESTVKVHVKHLLKKLNLHSRVEAAVWATKHL